MADKLDKLDKLDNLKQFNKGESGNPNGRPKGSKNRSTILRELLELNDQELRMHQAQIEKAIELKDTLAYKAVMDNAYKPHAQQVENDITIKEFDISKLYNGEAQ